MKLFRKILSLLIVASIFAALLPLGSSALTNWDGTLPAASSSWKYAGSGTSSSPYLIANAKQLAQFCADVRAGMSYTSKYFALSDDIGLGGTGSGVVNWYSIGTEAHPFTGKFDGAGHVIKVIKQDSNPSSTPGDPTYGGFFGYVTGAEIKNLIITGAVYMRSGSNNAVCAGSIAAYAVNTKITNCCSVTSVTVELEDVQVDGTYRGYSGGIVGHMDGGTLDGCFNNGKVDINYGRWYDSVKADVMICGGGVAGCIQGGAKVVNCYNISQIELTGDGNATSQYTLQYAGGVVGCIDNSTVANCYNTGTLDGHHGMKGSYIAGIAAKSSGTVKNCYSTGELTPRGIYVSTSNTVGENTGTCKNCYWYQSSDVSVARTEETFGYFTSATGGVTGGKNGITVNGKKYENGTPLLTLLNAGKPTVSGASGWSVEQTENNGYPCLDCSLCTLNIEYEYENGGTGSTSPAKGSSRHLMGLQVSVSLVPGEDSHVSRVKYDGERLYESSTIPSVLNFFYYYGEHTLTVRFAADIYTVSSSAGSNGSISPSGETRVSGGGSVVFTLLPDPGYKVSSVTVNGSDVAFSNNTYTLSGITADTRVAVYFQRDPDYSAQPDTDTTAEPDTAEQTAAPETGATDSSDTEQTAQTEQATDTNTSDDTTSKNKSDDFINDTTSAVENDDDPAFLIWVAIAIVLLVVLIGILIYARVRKK